MIGSRNVLSNEIVSILFGEFKKIRETERSTAPSSCEYYGYVRGARYQRYCVILSLSFIKDVK